MKIVEGVNTRQQKKREIPATPEKVENKQGRVKRDAANTIKCGICNKSFRTKHDPSIECDKCTKWICKDCGKFKSNKDIETIGQITEDFKNIGEQWRCEVCIDKEKYLEK